jgi:PAB1-binding protein PBP1
VWFYLPQPSVVEKLYFTKPMVLNDKRFLHSNPGFTDKPALAAEKASLDFTNMVDN